jgi:hypothetical protein
MILSIFIILYLIIAIIVYFKTNWGVQKTWEKIYLSFIWILLLPLYGVHKIIQNKL